MQGIQVFLTAEAAICRDITPRIGLQIRQHGLLPMCFHAALSRRRTRQFRELGTPAADGRMGARMRANHRERSRDRLEPLPRGPVRPAPRREPARTSAIAGSLAKARRRGGYVLLTMSTPAPALVTTTPTVSRRSSIHVI